MTTHNQKICPYPGLRPFTEEESIYFKGRDTHIEQITEQLSQKKFLMLTGASGDGKSSLVYAGLIPNARAGFFRAKYNNWIVADFRPERSPLQNLSNALNKYFALPEEKIEKELSFGFSSLVNIYKNSKYYIDQTAENWQKADETERKKLKKGAANLLILADQFEEFFTNPENYSKGAPSLDAQTVVNVLVETSKIALEADIPIYIVCTMRSDYIGQCAAFRGLPEMIGFSQFFVPRLKRKEIQQVVEEPAMLSGDKISPRLTEVLINELNDGFDQLPVLQHTLNALWNIADKGNQQLDLIHLAKLGGLSPTYLPKEDQPLFKQWVDALPEFRKQYFTEYSLGHVLSSHADILYETADEYYNNHYAKEAQQLSKADARLIVKTAFQCLTKIDESRAVRNRMTLQEITNIINQPHLTANIVGKLLNLFREQGNTFIMPFITDSPKSKMLQEDIVLDITHESLIRNWGTLKQWADEEHNNFLSFQDFNKQLSRWVKSGQSKGYLMPIGPLTFFEGWYNTLNPNKYWLARYNEAEVSEEEKLVEAEATLKNAAEFIKQSTRKLFFTRTVIKYGANKLLTYLGTLLLIGTCTYYYFDYQRKQNSSVISDISEKGISMLKSNKIDNDTKARFLINYERLNPGTLFDELDSLKNDSLAFDIGLNIIRQVQNYNDNYKEKINPLCLPLLKYLNDSKVLNIDTVSFSGMESKLEKNSLAIGGFCYANSAEPNPLVYDMITKHLKIERQIIHHIIEKKLPVSNIEQFNYGIELLLNLSESTNDASFLVSKISPFDNDNSKNTFDIIYPKNKNWKIPNSGEEFKYNGGYQIMAYAYSSLRDSINTVRCIDSVAKNNPNAYKTYYYENLSTVIAYASMRGGFSHNFFCEALLKKDEQVSGLPRLKIIEQLIANNSLFEIDPYAVNNQVIHLYNFVKWLIPNSSREMMFDYYLKFINSKVLEQKETINMQGGTSTTTDSKGIKIERSGNLSSAITLSIPMPVTEDEHNFRLAMYYKKLAFYESAKSKNRSGRINTYLYKAFEMYSEVSEEYRNKDFTIDQGFGDPNAKTIKNSVLFLFPYLIDEADPYNVYNTGEGRTFPFMDFLISNPEYHNLYLTKDNLDALNLFLYAYYQPLWIAPVFRRDSINYNYISFVKLINSASNNNSDKNTKVFYDLNSVIELFKKNDELGAMKAYNALDFSVLLSPDFQKNIIGDKADAHKILLKSLAECLAINGKLDESFKIAKALVNKENIRSTYMDIAYKLQEKGPIENTFLYLDSLFSSIHRDQKMGMKLFRVFGMIGGGTTIYRATMQMKDIPEKAKPRALQNLIRGICYDELYFRATECFPEYISSSTEMDLYGEIMNAEANRRMIDNFDNNSTNLSRSEEINQALFATGWESFIKENYSDNYELDYENGNNANGSIFNF